MSDKAPFGPLGISTHRDLLGGAAKHRALGVHGPQNAAGAPDPTVRAIQEEDQGVELRLQGRSPDVQTVTPGLRLARALGLISPLAYKELWYLLVP